MSSPSSPPTLSVFWHHVGREHGIGGYAPDLRKNDPETVARYLTYKEQRAEPGSNGHRFVRHDEQTLLELPPENAPCSFLIAYRIDQGLQYSIGYKKHNPWWLIDVVQIVEIRPSTFCVRDLFLDIQVNRDGSYKLLDMEDFDTALRLEIISLAEGCSAFRSLATALADLNSGRFPPDWLASLCEHCRPSA